MPVLRAAMLASGRKVKEGGTNMNGIGQRRTAVLADNHPMWLEPIERAIGVAGVDVVGTTSSARHALSMLEEHHPTVLVCGLDFGPGDLGGLDLVRSAREACPELKILILSRFDDQATIDAAFAAGANAYVLKTAHRDDLVAAVRQSFMHSVFLPGARQTTTPVPAPATPADDGPGLTRREREILELVAEGHSNAQLARMLWVTEQTVKFHLSNIYRKLDVANRTEASRWAQRNGLLDVAAGSRAA
jgi:DNA-binding NarL/FixJ family response regulator